jgi:UDP-glucose 6-dehydrogenase
MSRDWRRCSRSWPAKCGFPETVSGALDDADVVFIAVGTPPLADGNPDLRYLRQAGEQIGHCLNGRFTVVVNKSTVPVGCGNWVETHRTRFVPGASRQGAGG